MGYFKGAEFWHRTGFVLLMLLLATSVFSQQPPSEDEIPLEEGPIVVADEADVLVIVENSEVVTTLQTDVTTLQGDVEANDEDIGTNQERH